MKRLFIANRGEIAARIARTARDRALPSVVAVAPEDEQLVAQYHCDATAPLRSAASYADSDELIDAALREGCDAAMSSSLSAYDAALRSGAVASQW